MPGQDSKFDARYTRWLQEKSAWVPLGVIKNAPIDELARAGFSGARVEAFRSSLKAMEAEEMTNPGRASAKSGQDLIEAAQALGQTTNSSYYPSPSEMAREVHFNDLAPFLKAPIAYGVGLFALIFSLVTTNFGRSMQMESTFAKLSKALYMLGIASFASGIGLEVYGFYLRIRITGWAPVTNMYETVIWVAMIASIIGLVMEVIFQKTYAALAGSGVALLGTGLAATVSLLDPNIHQLPPVLRSNLWLGVHVLTIVSSYAAFALAMGLGVAATSLYLTATYKRSASLLELAAPMIAGLPMLGLGVLGYYASYGNFGAGQVVQDYGFWPSVILGCIGGVVTTTCCFAILGEAVNLALFRKAQVVRDELAAETYRSPLAPEVADPKVDQARRAQAMQATAGHIKPIASFIYRSMQVGILLVALGTFLGGVWADVSWGRFWGWDPKEVWALITLLIYLIPLHGRFAGWVNTFWLVMASVLCFSSVMMAWYGVNFVLGVGLHSYGFTSGKGQGMVGTVSLVVMSYAFAAAWRRHLSQQVVATA